MDQQFQPLRHRKQVRRADYTPLEDDSDAESFRRSNSNSSLHHNNKERKQLLCDKCWVQHERTRATKRCSDCDKNLCNSCATRDEIKRPWWIPACIVQCLRFMFNDVFTPHSIVDLYPEKERHWTQSQEASHVHQIPRVRTRTSLRSNESKHRECISESRRSRSSSLSDDRRKGKETKGHQDKTRKFKHSNSYEDKSKRRKSDDKRLSRNWSSEALVQRYKHDDIDRLRRYKDNWCSFDETYQQQEKNQSSDVDEKQHFRNNVKGKDIIIVLTDKDAKVVVNDDALPDCLDNSPPKRKSRRKSKPDITKNYTEEIFEEVPIYFKRDAKRSGRAETNDKTHGYDQYKTTKDTFNQQAKYAQQRNSPYTDNTSTSQHAYTNYLVEEPPDPCKICLEDLPGDEARTLACYHTFHTKCLLHLLSNSESMDFGITCPVCSHLTPVRNYYAKKDQWVRELPVNTTV